MQYVRIILALLVVAVGSACTDGTGEALSVGDGASVGQGGSMTRFAIKGNRMYVLDQQQINVFDISTNQFSQLGNVEVGFGLETIFANGDYLYLGANDAMYIYSTANPDRPSFVFRYSHIVSCDPVVVQGNRAYVTLRTDSRCNRGANALEILDIADRYNPKLIANYSMQSPHGLAIDGNILFLCEGEHGLKMYDVTNENEIQLLQERSDFFAYDVIARGGLVTVTGEDGIFQFSYANSSLQLLSKIPVSREEL